MKIRQVAERIELDEETCAELLTLFRDTSIGDLGKIEAAIDAGDPKAMADAAHSIKGAAANLGLSDISEAARVVEMRGRSGATDGVADQIKLLRQMVEEGVE